MSRRQIRPQAPRFSRHPPPDLLENKIASQAAEIERLAGDNHRLAAAHVTLRQELVVAQQEVERAKAYLRSIQTESDIQIRILLEKTAKLELEIRDGENVKKERRQAHIEAQDLARAGQELNAQIQHSSQELQKLRADFKSLPHLQAELDELRHEYKRVRAIFEYEKSLNMEKVEQLQAMEQKLIGMAREVEKLHAEVLDAEKRKHVPNTYGGGYVTPYPSYPPPVYGAGAYADTYGRPLVQMGVGPAVDGTIPYDGIGGTVLPGAHSVALRRGSYDPSIARK